MEKFIIIFILSAIGLIAQPISTTVRLQQLNDSTSALRTDLATKTALSDSTTELKDSLANRLLRMAVLEDSSASYNARVNVLEDSSTAYTTKFNTLQIEKWTDNDTGITFSGKLRVDSLFTNALIDIVDTSEIVNNSILQKKLNKAINSYSANTTLTANNFYVNVTTSTTDKIITLPITSISDGTTFHVKKADTGIGWVIISVSGGGTIDGVASLSIQYQYSGYTLVKSGSNYLIYGVF